MPLPPSQNRASRILLWLAFSALAAPFVLHAQPASTDAQKAMGTVIAAAASPSDAAALVRADWSPGLVADVIYEGRRREGKDDTASEVLYRLSERMASEIGDEFNQAAAIEKLGDLLRRHQEFPEAIALLRKAYALQMADPDNSTYHVDAKAETAVALALALNNSGQSEEAASIAAQAIDLAATAGDELTRGRAYSVAGSAATNMGNHRAAIFYLQKALDTAEKLKSLAGQSAVLNNLGIASRAVFDYDASQGYMERSLAIKRQQGPDARPATTLNNLGDLALTQDRYDEADKYFHLALESAVTPRDDDVRADVLVNLGLLAQGRKQFGPAMEALDQGIALAEKTGEREIVGTAQLFEANLALRTHNSADAQSHVDKARRTIPESGDQNLSLRLTLAQGDIYREQGLTDRARTEYLKAIDQFESLRLNIAGDESIQADFADNTRDVYTSLIDLDASSGKTADAFRYSELSRSRVLLDDLISGRADVLRLLTPEEAQKSKTLLGRLTDLNIRLRSAGTTDRKTVAKQIEAVRFDYSAFRTQVYAAHPELAARRADPAPVSVSRAAALLPDDHTALISYSVGAKAVWAFVITRANGRPVLRIHELHTNEDQLRARVKKWRDQIAVRDLGANAISKELYQTLLQPLQKDLTPASGKIDRLIVSPDSALWQIPFEALRSAEGRYAVEDYEIFYAPSATVLDRMRSVHTNRARPISVLALGNPTGDLPEAAAEVAGIGKLYGAGRSKVLTGVAATKAALSADAPRYSVIHIAAHGNYDDSRPLFSYLVLAPGKTIASTPDDGNLEAREIMDLHLNAKLVILSGCETARSSGSGVGIAGMSWSLFIAGAPATVASLWKVDSRSTEIVMTDLHKGLARGETTAQALRGAKLALMRNPLYRHPFYWAGFIGIGVGN